MYVDIITRFFGHTISGFARAIRDKSRINKITGLDIIEVIAHYVMSYSLNWGFSRIQCSNFKNKNMAAYILQSYMNYTGYQYFDII